MGKVWIAGGGTGGHIIPAIALYDQLVAEGIAPSEITFVTTTRQLDLTLVPESKYSVIRYGGSGLRRSPLGFIKSVWSNSVAALRLLAKIVAQRPRVVVGFGGYVTFATIVLSRLLGATCVVVEENAVLGAANALSSRFAQVVVGSFPLRLSAGASRKFVILGTPLRSAVRDLALDPLAKKRTRAELKIHDDTRLVVVVGGSLGAKVLNSTASEIAEHLGSTRYGDLKVVVFGGTLNTPEMPLSNPDEVLSSPAMVSFLPYVDDIYRWYCAADVVLSRAGASTVAELLALSCPMVLVPIRHSRRNHQSQNAEIVAQMGAGMVVNEEIATSSNLAKEIGSLLGDDLRRQQLASSCTRLARPHATIELSGRVVSYLRGGD